MSSPANAVDSKILFSTESGYEGAIRGMYQNMLMLNLGLTNGGLSLYMSLAADDLIPRSTGVNYQAFYQNSLLSSNSVVSGFWALSYEGIYRANILLENLESSDILNSEMAADIKGQALFVRAFYYFYLWQLYGDVPLVLDTDYRKNATMPRTDETLVIEQIIGDLTEAAKLITKEGREDKATPDYYAVHALLARINLFIGDYRSAESACNIVLDGDSFILDEVDKVFKTGSREVIWQLTNEYRNVAEARSFVPANTTNLPLFYLSDGLLSIFDEDDTRKSRWINANVIDNVDYFYPFKYQNRENTPITEYYVVLRAAEIYLVRAEARNRLEDYEGALNDLNSVRARAGLEGKEGLHREQIDILIERERRRELFAEWGHRWFDLKR